MQIRTRAWITGNDEVKADTMRLISELRSLWKAARNTLQYFKGSVGFSERTRNTIKWRPDFVAIVEEMEALLPPEEPECLESLLKEAKHEVIRGKIHELEFALAALGVKEETDVKMASNSTIEPTGSRT